MTSVLEEWETGSGQWAQKGVKRQKEKWSAVTSVAQAALLVQAQQPWHTSSCIPSLARLWLAPETYRQAICDPDLEPEKRVSSLKDIECDTLDTCILVVHPMPASTYILSLSIPQMCGAT